MRRGCRLGSVHMIFTEHDTRMGREFGVLCFARTILLDYDLLLQGAFFGMYEVRMFMYLYDDM